MNIQLRIAIVAVLAALGTIGYVVLVHEPASGVVADGCAAHGVDACPFCDPGLVEELGFCRDHGVPEALCTRCRPGLEAAFRAEDDWCGGHGLPESHCELCNPGVLDRWAAAGGADGAPPSADAQIAIVDIDVPRSRRPPSVTCATEHSLVRLATPDVARAAGLRSTPVVRAPLRETVEAPARIAYDARRHARLAARAPGVVTEVRTDLGEVVHAGDVLVVVDAPGLGAAKSALLQADARVQLWERNAGRERELLDKGLTTEREALAAETQLVESRIAREAAAQALATLGVDADALDRIVDERDSSSRLAVTAPFDGVVVELHAVVGEPARGDATLAAVADSSRLWALVDVDPRDVRLVSLGDPVLLVARDLPGETAAGRVTWISPQIDERTRTVAVRAELEDPDGRLRAGGFASARIVTRDGDEAVLVPKDAVQWEGCCNVAFVKRSETEYVPAKLRLGWDTGDAYEVLDGLQGGETVVTEGSFLLATELQKGSIGAGCCEVDHLGG